MAQIGDQVLHYHILASLGQGGMGQVYRALDTRLEREVALKFWLEHSSFTADIKLRLEREAKAVARLDHPNIAAIHSIESYQDGFFLCMTLYQGQNLEQRLSQGPLALTEALTIFRQVVMGLAHAHQRSVIHRDIKPANIFLPDGGPVKILDFGLAHLPASELTAKDQMMGTPSYCSPEQLKGEHISQQTDIWALGVLLFHLLTGELPFSGRFPQLMLAILHEDPKPLGFLLAQPGLQQLLEHCLAKDPSERYSNCEALLSALDSLDVKDIKLADVKPVVPELATQSSRRRASPLIGRQQDLEALVSLLLDPDNDVISIVGIGGAGKTSLAKAVISHPEVAAVFAEQRYFIALDTLEDAAAIPHEIARALDTTLMSNDSWQELSEVLQRRTVLLVLDNLEHLAADCVEQLDSLLLACPGIRLLLTSREVLRLEDEVVFDLKGLAIPPDSSADFYAYGASALLINKAKRLKRSFDAEGEKEAILEICRYLEGWPLGIELAVAWVRQLSLVDIAKNLKGNLDFLTQRSKRHVSRHQSARSAFDYSWQLLRPAEQQALVALSVFRGGCSAEAAASVCRTSLALIASLIDKSLLVIGEHGRYTHHSLIYQFCRERLEPDNPDSRALFAGHALYFCELAESAEPQLKSQTQISWLQRLEAEHDNFLAALSWSAQQPDKTLASRLACALATFWEVRGYYQLGRSWFDKLLSAAEPLDPSLRAAMLYAAGGLAWQQSDYAEARQGYQESLRIRREINDQRGIADCLHSLGIITKNQGDYQEAKAFYEESLALRRELGDQRGMANSLNNLGNIAKDQAESLIAQRLYEESLALSLAIGNQRGMANTLNNLGILASDQQQRDKAQQLYRESLEIRRQLGDQRGIAVSLNNLGNSAKDQQDFAYANSLFEESLEINQAIGNQQGAANTLKTIASIAVEQGDYRKARQLFAQSLGINQRIANKLELAGTLEDIAYLQLSLGQADSGLQLWAAAEGLRHTIQAPNTAKREQQLEQALRAIGGDSEPDHRRQAGQHLALEQAITLAFEVLKEV